MESGSSYCRYQTTEPPIKTKQTSFRTGRSHRVRHSSDEGSERDNNEGALTTKFTIVASNYHDSTCYNWPYRAVRARLHANNSHHQQPTNTKNHSRIGTGLLQLKSDDVLRRRLNRENISSTSDSTESPATLQLSPRERF